MFQPPTSVSATPSALVITNPGPGGVSAQLIAPTCWANCDGSTAEPILNIQDFVCFQNAFAAGDLAHADCNHDRALNAADFACFNNAFAAGCPCHRPGATATVAGFGTTWTVYAGAPFTVRFEAMRQVTLRLDSGDKTWTEEHEVYVRLDSPSAWNKAMLPPPLTIDDRTNPIPFELSPKSNTGRR